MTFTVTAEAIVFAATTGIFLFSCGIFYKFMKRFHRPTGTTYINYYITRPERNYYNVRDAQGRFCKKTA